MNRECGTVSSATATQLYPLWRLASRTEALAPATASELTSQLTDGVIDKSSAAPRVLSRLLTGVVPGGLAWAHIVSSEKALSWRGSERDVEAGTGPTPKIWSSSS